MLVIYLNCSDRFALRYDGVSSDNNHPAFACRMVIFRFRSQLVVTKEQPIR